MNSAAEYFAGIKPEQWIRVVEAATVPKTKVSGSMLVVEEGGGKEPIGNRIIETAEDLERTELRDSASGFVAYVPVGSIKKGQAPVLGRAGNKNNPLQHLPWPGPAGARPRTFDRVRSPSYIVRQMYDIQNGARNGPWSQLTNETMAHLSVDDMVSIAAYTSPRMP